MYLADCHNHTCCSVDSQAPLELVLEQAARVGLSHVCTTDHLDLVDRWGREQTDWDWRPSLAQRERCRALCPRGVELCMGIEINMPHLFPQRTRQLLSGMELDMVVGSAHNLSPDRGGMDFILLQYKEETACHDALDNYFDSLRSLSVMEEIDVLAHLPYVLRYMNDRDGNRVTLDRYHDRLEIILTNLITRGAGIEVNTNRGKALERYRPILEQYRRLGGEVITLGSDAHSPEDIGKGIKGAVLLLKETGFRYYTVYRRRKPEFIPLI